MGRVRPDKFDILIYCSESVRDSLDFASQSWFEKAGAERVVCYTDGWEEKRPGYEFIHNTCWDFRYQVPWVEGVSRMAYTLEDYIRFGREGRRFVLTGTDCLATGEWRGPFTLLENQGLSIGACRFDKMIVDASPKMTSNVMWGIANDETYDFAQKWIKVLNVFAEIGYGVKKREGSCSQMAYAAIADMMRDRVLALNENIYNSEHDDIAEWKRLVEKYKKEIRCLHFKGGRWRDQELVEEMLCLIS